MGSQEQPIFCAPQTPLHLFQRRDISQFGSHLGHTSAVPLTDGGETVAEVTGIDHKHPISRLDEVGRRHLHSQAPRASHHEGLTFFSQENLSQPLQRVAKNLDEVRRDMAWGLGSHSLEHRRLELHRAGDHQEFVHLISPSARTKASISSLGFISVTQKSNPSANSG